MITYSKLNRTFFKVSKTFAILLSSVIRAEEASILTSAAVIGSDINDVSNGTCPDPLVLIKGYYMT